MPLLNILLVKSFRIELIRTLKLLRVSMNQIVQHDYVCVSRNGVSVNFHLLDGSSGHDRNAGKHSKYENDSNTKLQFVRIP